MLIQANRLLSHLKFNLGEFALFFISPLQPLTLPPPPSYSVAHETTKRIAD